MSQMQISRHWRREAQLYRLDFTDECLNSAAEILNYLESNWQWSCINPLSTPDATKQQEFKELINKALKSILIRLTTAKQRIPNNKPLDLNQEFSEQDLENLIKLEEFLRHIAQHPVLMILDHRYSAGVIKEINNSLKQIAFLTRYGEPYLYNDQDYGWECQYLNALAELYPKPGDQMNYLQDIYESRNSTLAPGQILSLVEILSSRLLTRIRSGRFPAFEAFES